MFWAITIGLSSSFRIKCFFLFFSSSVLSFFQFILSFLTLLSSLSLHFVSYKPEWVYQFIWTVFLCMCVCVLEMLANVGNSPKTDTYKDTTYVCEIVDETTLWWMWAWFFVCVCVYAFVCTYITSYIRIHTRTRTPVYKYSGLAAAHIPSSDSHSLYYILKGCNGKSVSNRPQHCLQHQPHSNYVLQKLDLRLDYIIYATRTPFLAASTL